MGLFDFLLRLFRPSDLQPPATPSGPVGGPHAANRRIDQARAAATATATIEAETGSRTRRERRAARKPRLTPLRNKPTSRNRWTKAVEETAQPPYRFAQFGVRYGGYIDLSTDGDEARLARYDLPRFRTPDQLAEWLEMPVGKVAWLIHRFCDNYQPESARQSHYHCRWQKKRAGGWRLIEAPKSTLRTAQDKILKEILDRVPPHPAAHGFITGRSIVSNAESHIGRHVVVKFDLENFYATVTMARVTAIFRSVGYSREASIWLARLTTSTLPPNLACPENNMTAILPFLPRHLPQGAPTSPALANLSAYSLDVRLSGFARAYGANYTRYADDITFSGPSGLLRALPSFLPLVTQIIRSERFQVNLRKRKVIRGNQRQVVAGVVVNERTNVARPEFDRLKAILTNCVRHGAATQNRDDHDDFASHLRGRIAHVAQLNSDRGLKLLKLYEQIDWSR